MVLMAIAYGIIVFVKLDNVPMPRMEQHLIQLVRHIKPKNNVQLMVLNV